MQHLKIAIEKTTEDLAAHAKAESEARGELWRYNHRFVWYMFGLVLVAVLGPYIKMLIPQ